MSSDLEEQLQARLAKARRRSGRNLGLAPPAWEFWSDLGGALSIGGGAGVAGLGVLWGVYSCLLGPLVTGQAIVPGPLDVAAVVIVGGLLTLVLFVVAFVGMGFAALVVLSVTRILLSLCADQPGRDRVASVCAAAACALVVFLPFSFVFGRGWEAGLLVGGHQVFVLGWCQASVIATPGAYRDLRRRQAGRLKNRLRISLAGMLLMTIPIALLLSLLRVIEGGTASAVALLLAALMAALLHVPIGWAVVAWARRRFRRRYGLIRRST